MAKGAFIKIYLDDEDLERVDNYLSETSKDSRSSAGRRALLEKISAWEERQALVRKQLGVAS